VAAVLGALPNTREDYLRIRAIDPRRLGPVRRAAHLVYLNKTCFRGLFRVNRQGRFNVPYGAYARRYFDPANLLRFAARLQGVEIRCGDFASGLEGVTARDLVYLDPPYYKLGGYADFDRYTDAPFREADHERLAALCRDLDRRGVRFTLSQSDTPFVRRLFAGFRQERIDARREIQLSRRPARRGRAPDHERLSGATASSTAGISSNASTQIVFTPMLSNTSRS
jgi:DNA adenine methylase